MSENTKWWVMAIFAFVNLIFSGVQAYPLMRVGNFTSLGSLLFFTLCGSVIASLVVAVKTRNRIGPLIPPTIAVNIKLIHAGVEHDPGAEGYPVKIRAVMRNDSDHAVDVRLSEYAAKAVPIKKLLLDVLQVNFSGTWAPSPHGAERLAAYPGQTFQAWIAPVSKFTKDDLERLRGEIGTLGVLVNAELLNIPL